MIPTSFASRSFRQLHQLVGRVSVKQSGVCWWWWLTSSKLLLRKKVTKITRRVDIFFTPTTQQNYQDM